MTDLSILFVDDEAHLRRAAEQTFDLADLGCEVFDDPETALTRITRSFRGILVTDIRMPGMDGTELMRRALEIDPELPIILVTGHGDVELAVTCMKNGAYDFIKKPYDPHSLVDCARRALEKRELILENRALCVATDGGDLISSQLTGRSAAINELRTQLRAIAHTDADLLIHGETGTGKERAARTLHEASARSGGTFVHVNCAALPADMIESELFGHVAGAFSGAMRDRYGKFEHAHRGILCLDEIDSLPQALQAKLLQALQNKQITRLGSNDVIPTDFRIIAIAKTDLKAAVAEGLFRADLLYRLNVVTLRMPTLAERREDIPALFTTLLNETHARYKREIPPTPTAMLQALTGREWEGNIRELRNAAERVYLGLEGAENPIDEHADSLAARMAKTERALISAALSANAGSVKETCDALQIPRKTLYDKMKKYRLERTDFT